MEIAVKQTFAFAFLSTTMLAACSPDTAPQAQAPASAAPIPSFTCDSGTSADGRLVDVTGSEHWLYSKPSETSPRILNQKASSILKETVYHSIDSTTRVQVQCTSGEWYRVQMTEPEWLRHVSGWVQSKYLLDPSKSGSAREFTEADVFWDKHTAPFKPQILRAINEIHQSNSACTGTLDPSSVTKSPSRSTSKRTMYFVTCGKGERTQNIYFSLD